MTILLADAVAATGTAAVRRMIEEPAAERKCRLTFDFIAPGYGIHRGIAAAAHRINRILIFQQRRSGR